MAAQSDPLLKATLSSVQMEVVVNLAAGNAIVSTAQRTGVHRATIHNWLKLPEFRAELDHAQRDYDAYRNAKLREITQKWQSTQFDTIRHILTDPAEAA